MNTLKKNKPIIIPLVVVTFLVLGATYFYYLPPEDNTSIATPISTTQIQILPTSSSTPVPSPTLTITPAPPTLGPLPTTNPTATSTIPPTVVTKPLPTQTPTNTMFTVATPTTCVDADAIVRQDVNLRPEPNIQIGKIGVLKAGQCLKILKRVTAWFFIEVIEPMPESNMTQGWVSDSSSFVTLNPNFDLDTIPITLTATPTSTRIPTLPLLLQPKNLSTFHERETTVLLQWAWDGVLQPDEYFFVIGLYKNKDCTDDKVQFDAFTKEKSFQLPQWLYNEMCITSRDFEWMVVVASTKEDAQEMFFDSNVEKRILIWQ